MGMLSWLSNPSRSPHHPFCTVSPNSQLSSTHSPKAQPRDTRIRTRIKITSHLISSSPTHPTPLHTLHTLTHFFCTKQMAQPTTTTTTTQDLHNNFEPHPNPHDLTAKNDSAQNNSGKNTSNDAKNTGDDISNASDA